jgi:hypothetical protein
MVYFVDDPTQKWELDIRSSMRNIIIRGKKGCMELRPTWTVSPPNIIERLFGITFEQKVEKTKKKAQKRIDKLNADIERANNLAGIQKADFSNPPLGGSGLPSRPPKDYGLLDDNYYRR